MGSYGQDLFDLLDLALCHNKADQQASGTLEIAYLTQWGAWDMNNPSRGNR